MSRKAYCLDTAVMENSHESLNSLRVDPVRYRSSEPARTDIVSWIEGFDHRRRLQTAIGHRTPMRFERRLMAASTQEPRLNPPEPFSSMLPRARGCVAHPPDGRSR